MTIGKFDYKKWIVENKFGKTPNHSNYSMLNEQTGSGYYSCNTCSGCVRDMNGPFSSLEECQASGCFEGSLEEYAISIGISTGVAGVGGTTMSAEDQYCIKCQSNSWPDSLAQKCACCNTDYDYEDEGGVTYNPGQTGIPPRTPDKDPGKFPQKKQQKSKMNPRPKRNLKKGLREFITDEVKNEIKELQKAPMKGPSQKDEIICKCKNLEEATHDIYGNFLTEQVIDGGTLPTVTVGCARICCTTGAIVC
tara:strand:- start:1 stop:750 length:750 start_codon:yes stop_codon:yes gene_type:complete